MSSSRIPVLKTYKLYIGGAFPRTESGRYLPFAAPSGRVLANICHASRKDARDAVKAARAAFPGWSGASAYLRGQILYRLAEMLEARAEAFAAELKAQGQPLPAARKEVQAAVDLLVHYAGWTDKVQQVFSSVNPVASSHFNFSMQEPTGVVAAVAPDRPGLGGLVGLLAPALAGGNTVVAAASETFPLTAITLAEAIHSSDVPGGAVNILTGVRNELLAPLAAHMDVNAVVYAAEDGAAWAEARVQAAENVKRMIRRAPAAPPSPYAILDTLETKTTWHPVGV